LPTTRPTLASSSRAFALALALASASADKQSLDCPLRQIGVDYAQKIQPFRDTSAFRELADALNGAQEAQNCSVGPSGAEVVANGGLRVQAFALPPSSALTFFADASKALPDATADGSQARPFGSLRRAVEAVRAARAARRAAGAAGALTEGDRAFIVLRAGTFFLASAAEGARTLELSAADSFLTVQAFPHEDVVISGGVPLNVDWTAATPPTRSLYEWKSGSLGDGFDAAPAQSMTVAQAQAACSALATCAGFTYSDPSPSPSGAVMVSFKYEAFWAPGSGSTYVRNRGYEPGANSLYTADVSNAGLTAPLDALRVAGVRQVRARYPNVKTVEQMDAMQVSALSWTAQSSLGLSKEADYTFNPATPLRNDTIDGFFQTFKIGVGGNCSFRFTPQASYWCSDNSQGGGPGPYSAPVGMKVSNAATSLPHTPYSAGAGATALIHSWRAGRWFSWVFQSSSASYDAGSGSTVFNFSLTVGGNQGSRGGDAGQEFFIENVLDELDNPGEFFFDASSGKLYLWYNATGEPPSGDAIVAPQLAVLINSTGSQAEPVVGVGFLGLTFRDSSPNYLGPHGTPSGGDWAVERSAALFFEGTEQTLISGCLLTSLDANAVFFSGYNRGAVVTKNEFLGIGETAISQWGYADGSPVPGMGFDLTAGNQPRGTQVTSNVVHEVGLYTKQNSFYFQSQSFGNVITDNIAYNGPRAGVNFDDGAGGGSVLERNVLANFCRESSDHGP
jgi:hypothetical protein